jgi:hypothetical protein
MAKSQYSGDSPFLPPLSLRPGMSGSRNEDPVKFASFPALPVNEASCVPAAYVLDGGATMYIGEGVHCGRRLQEHGTLDTEPDPRGPFPTTTSID